MHRFLLLLPFSLIVAMLAGCGNKGPLVLPPTRPVPASSAPAPVLPSSASSSAMPALQQP
ncbi:lipoprotein [Rhodanobacter ginsengisoli]|uniref:Lipoprotein n=1 Tax=Rhodanobacter ginsengisoli TaxID=418646 RepID=A0ABW0QVQ2_9GAMM